MRTFLIDSSGFSKKHFIQLAILTALAVAWFATDAIPHGDAEVIMNVDGKDRYFVGEIVSDMTVLDALNASILAGNIPVSFSIDDAQDSTQVQWSDGRMIEKDVSFFLNGKLIDGTKIHDTPIRRGDVVTFRLL